MIKKIQIWYHRRRAVYHTAIPAHKIQVHGGWSGLGKASGYHDKYKEFHLAQIERLSK